ncbi:MAG: helix-turn-helix transcriptional regulator [Lachnospiraceae bacterium]|nr:helix-turn-helix domain-containing protein [Lachnospiraceae bacterium]MDD7051485.1 helix-turn-helix transcriptional regulator [Lachnospiraceae bacterium]MDY4096773.1 helix-turn-helix transcriptional regulator [Lachnospiraceae bacterium]
MQELKIIIAKNIQALRQARGMTQAELAEKLNYSDKSVSKWERGESLPDILVLKEIADLFEVSLDYLVEAEHGRERAFLSKAQADRKKKRGYYIITATSILLVAIFATLLYFILAMVFPGTAYPWLCYAYGVPTAMVVWLVFNSVWFNPRLNFSIVSLLVWSLLAALYLTFYLLGYQIWPILFLGIPIQVIIWMWSNLRKKNHEE